MMLSIDLAHLTENPVIRWGYSWEMGSRFHVDDPRPEDHDKIRAFLTATGRLDFWPLTHHFLVEAPEHVSMVRDHAGGLRGYAIAVTPGATPAFARSDPVLGPRVDHARRLGRASSVLCRDVYDVAHTPGESPIPMLGMACILRAFRGNPRFAYLPIDRGFPGAVEFASALGAEHLPRLDARIAGTEVECHIIDYGLGGLLAAQREVVYREAGLPAPERAPDPASVHEVVRGALRSLNVPSALAASPLARGDGIDARAASVRELLEGAVDACFGQNPDEELMRAVLVRGYLDPAPNHELAADELSLSRSAYFRRLKLATERLSDYLETEQDLADRGSEAVAPRAIPG
jgi:hypothetical protein